MIAYTTVGTNDLKKAAGFYDSLFGEIGIKQLWADENFVGYGLSMDQPMFAVCNPHDKEKATVGNGTMIALSCADKEAVHKIHEKAMALGAANEGDCGPRGDTGFYCGYFRDLDGNKINAFAMVQPG